MPKQPHNVLVYLTFVCECCVQHDVCMSGNDRLSLHGKDEKNDSAEGKSVKPSNIVISLHCETLGTDYAQYKAAVQMLSLVYSGSEEEGTVARMSTQGTLDISKSLNMK